MSVHHTWEWQRIDPTLTHVPSTGISFFGSGSGSSTLREVGATAPIEANSPVPRILFVSYMPFHSSLDRPVPSFISLSMKGSNDPASGAEKCVCKHRQLLAQKQSWDRNLKRIARVLTVGNVSAFMASCAAPARSSEFVMDGSEHCPSRSI